MYLSNRFNQCTKQVCVYLSNSELNFKHLDSPDHTQINEHFLLKFNRSCKVTQAFSMCLWGMLNCEQSWNAKGIVGMNNSNTPDPCWLLRDFSLILSSY